MSSSVDLRDLLIRLADRRPGRTEANVQSDLHMLLTVAPLDLGENDLEEIILESPAGQRRRIDVEAGFTVFEVKRDLRAGTVRTDAVAQLAGYVASRVRETGQRYVGVLTDGAEWHLYHLAEEQMLLVSSFTVDTRDPQVELFCVWLEGVLATSQQIVPTPREIERRLGAHSSAHALDAADLRALYNRHRDLPTVKLKRHLWAKLLTTALGTSFHDEDELFVEHTLLVMTAEIISHAVVGFDPAHPTHSPATLLGGGLFTDAQIGGVVEADFFDWPVEVDGGDALVRALARRLTRFAWSQVEHDVMKVLYESVISADQRHRLGEYYTPDWLAEAIVIHAVDKPLDLHVLDPSCGSGTFLFHAVRHYLDAADAAGVPGPQQIEGVTRAIAGIDVHPVAVTLARVTYLLAIGMQRLQANDRPPFSIPVYLGDSMQWGQQRSLLAADMLTIPTDDGAELFANELQFPNRLLTDAGRFDRLVSELADRAAKRPAGSPPPSLAAVFRLYAVHPDDQEPVARTFATMCELHDSGRDHIWGYYVRNLARPVWQARDENRVDVLVGNPPWLAYRFMPEATKADFRAMSNDRGFWAGAAVATHQDLSGLFAARVTELYLKTGGRFGFVMPLAALSRRQFTGFRTGSWSTPTDSVHAAFDAAWDLHAVKPSFFPVPACVLFGHRASDQPTALARPAQAWSGRLSARNPSLTEALPALTHGDGVPAAEAGPLSPYAPRFTQGASLVPRMLVLVESAPASPLGAGAGRRAVRSQRSANEKKPWKDLPPLAGNVERQFVRPVHLGNTVLPFRVLDPQLAVIPWDGQNLLAGKDERLDLYPGLAGWWRAAEQLWETHRNSSAMNLVDQIDYRRKLRGQLPAAKHRVVYSKGGMYMAAAIIADPTVAIDHKLYWATATGLDEARYLTAVLNSTTLLELVRPLQARGEHNPRDFDKYIFQIPIPLYDPDSPQHRELTELAERAEAVAVAVELPAVSFQAQRRRIRQALDQDGVAQKTDDAVKQLLAPGS